MAYRYAIIGTGAVGGYYGGLLARAGGDVHFLLHRDAEHVRRHGLIVQCKQGDFALPRVNAYGRAAEMPPCDVAVVALKTTQNSILLEILPHVLKPDGFVLLLQNGLLIEDEIAGIVGPGRVVGGVCFLCSNKVGPGHIHHLDYGDVAIAEYDPDYRPRGVSDRLHRLVVDFARAGVRVEAAPDLGLMRWKKLVWNIPYNGLSVALDATTDALMADLDSLALVESLMHEVIAGAAACGHEIPGDYARFQMDRTARMTPYRTSMKIDFDAARPMELQAIFANPLLRAGRFGRPLPRIQMLYQQLRFLDARRGAR
jgi:2-dehydropantoate 2-reductase